MAAPFSSANIGIGLFEDDVFFYFLGLGCFEMMHFSTFWELHTST